MHSQMLKGVLEGCILYIISQEEVYGYELSTKLNQYGFTFVSEGSIYPLLLRMQKEKLIEGTLKTSNLGPKRKYYHLTKKGLEQLEVFKESWDMVSTTVNRLLGGEKQSETR
ncbi:PadR family transcriptional regulator [Bacillus mycoides]|uniref:PadR family transcriptional regulator n=1 Tax=Bacillus mycoides TaxID=1405 RepID=UPI0008722D73|nr:PadR family transcriptional regulator [Bacillus mycoides]OFD67075.1 PadR family transcriptional regulator [Bacillus mycoides]OFD68810.1 PadR family transcriptional regulator [Bacillus mycoides]OFD99955.1 PadR family transcriptional regulator [Bacillus mycoides]